MKYTAFISHSNKDEKALHTVREYLEGCGYPCFASERDLMHNANWQTQLVEAMDQSTMLIYLHSKNSNASSEVSREINYFADKCHRPILVYRLDDVAYNRDRAYYLQSINYIDSLLKPEDGLEQLAANVKHTLEGLPAEGWENGAARKRRLFARLGAAAAVIFAVLLGYLVFHGQQKGKLERWTGESAALMERAEGWLASEDSLEYVLPGIDRAEALFDQCAGLKTVSVPERPDFQRAREKSLQTMSEIRDRRISTVKALYEPLKYLSRESSAASAGAIMSNIDKVHLLDSLLGLPEDEEVSTIYNKLKATLL